MQCCFFISFQTIANMPRPKKCFKKTAKIRERKAFLRLLRVSCSISSTVEPR